MRESDDRPFWGIWLFALLGLPWIVQISDYRPNWVETGAVVESPGFEPARFLESEYFDELDVWAASSFGLRGAGLRARAAVDYELFGDSTAPWLVTVGRDGWIFWNDYLDPDCDEIAAIRPPPVVDGLDSAHFLITLPKAAYHGDRLPEAEDACVGEARDSRRAAFGGREIDLDAGLEEMASEGIPVFIPDDTHWSPEARVSVARSVVEALAPGLWDDEAIVHREVERLAGLSRVIGILRSDPVTGPVTTLEVEVIEQRSVEFGGSLLVLQSSTSELPGAIPGVTYLMGDSQMAYVVPLLAPYFEDLRYESWSFANRAGSSADQWPDPDRVIVQSIEHAAAGRLEDPVLLGYLERLADSD